MRTEKVPMAIIYKHKGNINLDYTDDGNKGFEVYGFLKVYLKVLEEDLMDSFEPKSD